MTKRRPGRPKKHHGPRIYQRNGRYYGDFRAYSDVGGGREALSEPGQKWGTTDADIAAELFAERLEELRKKSGTPTPEKARRIGLKRLIFQHIRRKRAAGQTSEGHMVDLKQRLRVAVEYFGAERDPRTIEAEDVRKWVEVLASTPNGRGGTLAPVTQRNYLFALSGVFRRAQEGGYVPPGYNPVAALVEKPRAQPTRESDFFEVPEAALILEAARAMEKRAHGNATPHLHAIVATFLLTGGRKSEVLGLDVEDVSFDRRKIHFRPNAHRGLKTRTSHRMVPLWPQLEEILRAHVFGSGAPRAGLLFPSRADGMIGNLQKSLDEVAKLAGVEALKTRALRHTYCSARLQTVSRIVRPGADPERDDNPYEWVPVAKFTVQREMGHGGAALVDRVYGHVGESPHRSEVVEYRAEKHREELGERLRAVEVAG
ncbi:MAG TPA: tyrosine-type recombinase/integrase [Longimicrobiales bacterium]|nr:tyrosine-type recombinase/integrase [Longimicrobiales bacterium]